MTPEVVRSAMKTVLYPNPPSATCQHEADGRGLLESGKIQKESITDMDAFMNPSTSPRSSKMSAARSNSAWTRPAGDLHGACRPKAERTPGDLESWTRERIS
jgi:hypothetical protein